jgi:hypothetical protein
MRYSASGMPGQEYELRFFEGREMEKPTKCGPNQMQWGPRLDSMRIYFDDVFRIPPSSQGGKFCVACRSQATFVKLDDDGEPQSYLCAEHVVEARR